MVVSLLLAYWFIKFGRNKEVYGLNPSDALKFLSTVNSVGAERLDNNTYVEMQKKILTVIETLVNRLRTVTDDDILKNKIIVKIKQLYSVLDTSVIDPININNIIKSNT